ncbi:MAG: tripartite tricarboxylate transporter TctB family protein [Thermodesulfobacteriota bacterium]
MVRADFLTGIGLISLSLYVIFESWRMPRLEHLKIHPLSVPGIVPAFIGMVLLIFGGVLVIRSVRRGGHRLGVSYKGFRRLLGNPGHQRLLLTAVLCIGYAGFLIGTFPYWLATGLFIFVFMILFEWEPGMNIARWRKCLTAAALIAFFSSAAITLIFERLFLVALP